MKKRILSLALATVLALGLAAPALAYNTPDFTDIPADHWAYESVMKMADAGVIKGTGEGRFSPDSKVSAEMLLTLVGRIAFSEVTVREGDSWYGPYVAAAQNAGWLEGTNVTDANLTGEISRYDMAVILAKCVELLKIPARKAESSKVTDHGEIPMKYADAVLTVYGTGLIKGDEGGNFNGANSMTRQEAATVMDRLLGLAPSGGTQSGTGQESPDRPTEPQPPEESTESREMKLDGWIRYGTNGDPEHNGIGVEDVPFELRYTEDSGATYQVIAEGVTGIGGWYGDDVPGRLEFTAQIDEYTFDKFWNGNGQLYISAETTVNGQHYATQDRRTDGHATIVPIASDNWSRIFVDLVPPDRGETVDIQIFGQVIANTTYIGSDGHREMKHYGYGRFGSESVLTNSTVRIYFDPQQEGANRTLIGETTADGGEFDQTITIDTAYYRTTGAWYVVEIEATLDGQFCQNDNQTPVTLETIIKRGIGHVWAVENDEFYEATRGYPRP